MLTFELQDRTGCSNPASRVTLDEKNIKGFTTETISDISVLSIKLLVYA